MLKVKDVYKARKIYCPSCGKELIHLNEEGNSFWCDDCDLDIDLNPDEGTPVSIYNDILRVDWYNAEEGYWGDYNPANPDDENLLRFVVYFSSDGENWDEVEDASYCTQVPADTKIDTLTELLYTIFKEYASVIQGYPETSVKKLGERMSWISCIDRIRKSTLNILEQQDYQIHGPYMQDREQYFELEWYSPAGEDVIHSIFFDGTEKDFIKQFCKLAEDFDPDEHAEMWVDSRGRGGVPATIRELLDDAEAIKKHLAETAEKLKYK